MKLDGLKLLNYRNISNLNINPCSEINIIYGENAQGKTNILEAIWMLSGSKSFRGAKDCELVKFGSDKACIESEFMAQGREQTIKIDIESNRTAMLNGVNINPISLLCENFQAIVFSPNHLTLITDGPQARRKFIDNAISQIIPRYSAVIKEYNRALKQRNAVLRDIRWHSELLDMIDAFEDRISHYGAKIMRLRDKYISKLSKYAEEIYDGISGKIEKIYIKYSPQTVCEDLSSENDIYIKLRKSFKNSRDEDINNGTTSVGPHRDDISIDINELSARIYGSQGQQRSAAIALKLAEASIIKEAFGEQPIALLDDVMSELDENRQDYILNHIKDWQVFITCCDLSQVLRMSEGNRYKIQGGRLID